MPQWQFLDRGDLVPVRRDKELEGDEVRSQGDGSRQRIRHLPG